MFEKFFNLFKKSHRYTVIEVSTNIETKPKVEKPEIIVVNNPMKDESFVEGLKEIESIEDQLGIERKAQKIKKNVKSKLKRERRQK